MNQKEENIEKNETGIKDIKEKIITSPIEKNEENNDISVDNIKDNIVLPHIDVVGKGIKTKKSKEDKDKINNDEFDKRVKEIMQAGQELESESESESRSDSQSTYSYASTCSTCRSDSTHYHI